MEMQIYSPADEGGYLKEIRWNFEELKAAVAEKAGEYAQLAYGEGQMREARADRAMLNRFRAAIEGKRKEIKKAVTRPYEAFEAQVREVVALIDDAVANIDAQVKASEAREREEKRGAVLKLFGEAGLPEWAGPEAVWDDRWLNKTYAEARIKDDLAARKARIEADLAAIGRLPEHGAEAMVCYRRTLDLASAMAEARRLKAEAEEAARLKAEAEEAAPEAEAPPDAPEERARFTVLVEARKSRYGLLNELFGSLKKHGVAVTVAGKEILNG